MAYSQNCYPPLEQKSSLQLQRAKIVTPAWITTQLTSLILKWTFSYRLRGLAMRPRNSSLISAIKCLVFIKSCFCDAQTANLYILNSFEKNPRTTFPIFHFLKATSSWSMSLASHRMKVSCHHPEVLLFQISSQSLQGLWCMDSVNFPTCAELSKENISSTRTALQPSLPSSPAWRTRHGRLRGLGAGQRVKLHSLAVIWQKFRWWLKINVWQRLANLFEMGVNRSPSGFPSGSED